MLFAEILTRTVFYCSVSWSLFPFEDADVSCEYGSNKYYALCGFGGVLSCGLTHTAVMPLDLVKCHIQVCICTVIRNIGKFFQNSGIRYALCVSGEPR